MINIYIYIYIYIYIQVTCIEHQKKHCFKVACPLISACWLRKALSVILVGGFNLSEKYESQLGWLFPIYGKKIMFQTTNQNRYIPYEPWWNWSHKPTQLIFQRPHLVQKMTDRKSRPGNFMVVWRDIPLRRHIRVCFKMLDPIHVNFNLEDDKPWDFKWFQILRVNLSDTPMPSGNLTLPMENQHSWQVNQLKMFHVQ